MNRIFRTLDVLLGLTLVCALAMTVLTALPSSAMAATTVGAGPVNTEQRSVAAFDAIAVSGSFEVLVRQVAAPQVAGITVRAQANLLPLIETVVGADNKLSIRWQRSASVRTSARPVIEVAVLRLHSLASSGASDIRVNGLTTPRLDAAISGSGGVHLMGLSSDELALRIAGSGDMVAAGQTARLRISIAGSGDVKAEALKADDVTVNIAGSGDAAVHAQQSLKVSVAGSGDVVYSGNAVVKTSMAGSGSVRKR